MDNKMTFFSGTDTATLREEGTDRNNFVSLIVNNAGDYTAAITRKVLVENIQASVTYELFGEGRKTVKEEYSSSKEKIEWFYLKIEKANVDSEFKDIDNKLKEIKDSKSKKYYAPASVNSPSTINYTNTSINKKSEDKKIVQKKLFDEDNLIPYGDIRYDKDTVETLVVQLITCSIFVSKDSKIDIDSWAKKLPNLCKRRFGDDKLGKNNFSSWVDTYVEFILWESVDENLINKGLCEDEVCAILAYDLIEALEQLPKNEYINMYIEALQNYIL